MPISYRVDDLARAAAVIQAADGLVITAGAGMGVDSGLPDFRSADGFWRAYPALKAQDIFWTELATPESFKASPWLPWGFYGHRLQLYRQTEPHAGFALLRQWAEMKPLGAFVFTSNVDGQFQKAGFAPERVVECHGSLHRLQCLYNCTRETWSADEITLTIDPATCAAQPPLPICPHCGNLARPNLLMFDDGHWIATPYEPAEQALGQWWNAAAQQKARLAVIELGAGNAIPTVRWFGESLHAHGATLIRINPREAHGPPGTLRLPLGALDALTRLAERCG